MKVEIHSADYSNELHGREIIDLMSEYAQDPMGGQKDLSDEVKKSLVVSLEKIPGAFSVIAYVDEKPAGLINCFEGFSTFSCLPLVNIHDVIVSSDYRGQGISMLMLEKVEQIANSKGCCKLTLEVLEGNKAAQNSYQKFGFSAYELDPEVGRALFWEKKL